MTVRLLVDGAAGIYVPRQFVDRFDPTAWAIDPVDAAILRDPEHEHYWDVWEDVLRDARHFDGHNYWYLSQDDDLFAVRDDHEWEDAYE